MVFQHLGSRAFLDDAGLLSIHRLVSGGTGVQLFCVLSGFLITCLAFDEIERTGTFDYPKFLQRRALRLFPLYYLAIGAIGLLSLLSLTEASAEAFIYAGTYMYNVVPREHYNGLLAAFHTLATEEQFYLSYGVIVWLAHSRIPFRYPVTTHSFLILIIIIGLAFGPALGTYLGDVLELYKPNRMLFLAMSPLLWGCLAASVLKFVLLYGPSNGLLALTSRGRYTHWFLITIFLFFYLGYANLHRSYHLLSIAFAILLLDLYLFRKTSLAKALENRVLIYLGTISYGIYVWQAVINGSGPKVRWIDSPVLSTSLVFIAAVLSYEFYEKRFLKLKRY